jgi:hypothetical protein
MFYRTESKTIYTFSILTMWTIYMISLLESSTMRAASSRRELRQRPDHACERRPSLPPVRRSIYPLAWSAEGPRSQ